MSPNSFSYVCRLAGVHFGQDVMLLLFPWIGVSEGIDPFPPVVFAEEYMVR